MQTFIDQVYKSVQGVFEDDILVPGVKAAFADGQLCMDLYEDVFEAKCRLNDKYNDGSELADVEMIINRMFDIMEEVGHQMYLYGAQFGIPEGTDTRSPIERSRIKEE